MDSPAPSSTRTRRLWPWLLALPVVGLLYLKESSHSDAVRSALEREVVAGRDAVRQCKEQILRVSHAPTSVEWIDDSSWKVEQPGGMSHRWLVNSKYSARGPQGDIRVHQPVCVLDRDSQGGWTLAQPLPWR